MISNFVAAETYTCSTDLSQIGKSGVETTIFTRTGDYFINSNRFRKNFPVKIMHENASDLMLYEVIDGNNYSNALITIINKKNNKYMQDYLNADTSFIGKVARIYGSCIVQ